MRVINRYPMDAIEQLNSSFPGQFDLYRARQGQLGGAFWTANAPCPAAFGRDPGPDFLNPTESVQHALESLDLIHAALARWPEVGSSNAPARVGPAVEVANRCSVLTFS